MNSLGHIKGLDHIGIVTDDVEKVVKLYEELLDIKVGPLIHVPDQGVKSAVVPMETGTIEIMQPTDPNSGVQRFLDKRGPGIHHIAVKVEDKQAAIEELQAKGVQLIIGSANGKLSAFIHPKSSGGLLIELCERKTQAP